MDKPTMEEIEKALRIAGGPTCTGNLVILAAAYRATAEQLRLANIDACNNEARAEMLDRQYAELAENSKDWAADFPDHRRQRETMLKRHAAEREGK